MYEGAHLYQHYGLGWTVWARGPFVRDYDYELVEDRTFVGYSLEKMEMSAQHYCRLRSRGSLPKKYQKYALADYTSMLLVK